MPAAADSTAAHMQMETPLVSPMKHEQQMAQAAPASAVAHVKPAAAAAPEVDSSAAFGYGGSDVGAGAAGTDGIAVGAEVAPMQSEQEPMVADDDPTFLNGRKQTPSPAPAPMAVAGASSAKRDSPLPPFAAKPARPPSPADAALGAANAKPSALALVNAAFPQTKEALAAAATPPSLPPPTGVPNSQAVLAAVLTPEARAQAESDMSAGVAATARGDWHGALSKMNAALEPFSAAGAGGWKQVPLVWLKQRSTVCAKLGRTADAYADAHRMTSAHADQWAGWYTLSTLLGRDKQYADALRECRRAWKLVPKRKQVRAQVAALRAEAESGRLSPTSAAASSASIERLEREADSDRKKVAERLAQLEAKLHIQPPSVLNEEEDVPGQFEEEEEAAAAPAAAVAAAEKTKTTEQSSTSINKAPATAAAATSDGKSHAHAVTAPCSPDKHAAAAASAPKSPGRGAALASSAAAAASSLISFGTYKLSGSAAVDVVTSALRSGFRRLDTGASYGNEEQVGKAMVASGVPRAQVHLCTKLAWADLTTTEGAYSAALASLRRLGVSYVDCLLLHHPGRAKLPPSSPIHATSRLAAWRALERLQSEGRARKIGVSNFEVKHLAPLLAQAKVRPAVNQVEMHPLMYQTQRELARYCAEQGVTLEAYSPLGSGRKEMLTHPLLLSLCRSIKRSPAEVLLRWSIQHSFVPVVKATQHAHQRLDLAVAGVGPDSTSSGAPSFTLTEEQMRTLDDMGQGKDAKRFAWDPSTYA
jgi:diketogulonate reductase-like aldo/keto reductase